MSKVATLLGLAISCVVAPVMSAKALAQEGHDSFDFAATRTPGWTLTATTTVNRPRGQPGRPPTVARIDCKGESRQFTFSMMTSGELQALRMTFLGAADSEGDRQEITLLGDHLWLYVDGERWEYANIPTRSSQFSNLQYPGSEESTIVLPLWHGHEAVRKSDGQPWLHLSRIYERLIGAKKIEWSFKSRDWAVVDQSVAENQLPRQWQTTRYPIDNAGLQNAVSWCARQVSSDAAYILPPR